MEPTEALNLMRTEPLTAFKDCAFMVTVKQPEVYMSREKKVILINNIEKAKSANMFQIDFENSEENGTDYFYPYVTGETGVGFTFVPADCPVGTLVFTGGMNGCAIQVNKTVDGENLVFMHDKDAKSMSQDKWPAILAEINEAYQEDTGRKTALDTLASELCRVEPKDYMGEDTEDGTTFYSFLIEGRTRSLACYLVAVKREGFWEIYNSPIVFDATDSTVYYERAKVKKGHSVAGAVTIFKA